VEFVGIVSAIFIYLHQLMIVSIIMIIDVLKQPNTFRAKENVIVVFIFISLLCGILRSVNENKKYSETSQNQPALGQKKLADLEECPVL
jgi:positive regulator of sigma E activity